MEDEKFKALLKGKKIPDNLPPNIMDIIKDSVPTTAERILGQSYADDSLQRQIEEMSADNERKEKLAESKERIALQRERRNFWTNLIATGVSLVVAILALIRSW